MDLYTKNGKPLIVKSDKVYSKSGKIVGRITDDRVHDIRGKYVGTIVGDRLVHKSEHSSIIKGSFSAGNIGGIGKGNRGGVGISGSEPKIPD